MIPQLDLSRCVHLPPEISRQQNSDRRIKAEPQVPAKTISGNGDPASSGKRKERDDDK